MKIEDKRNKSTNEICAKMFATFYFRVNKGDKDLRKSFAEQYLDLSKTYYKGGNRTEFRLLSQKIKNQTISAALLYLEHYDLTVEEKNSLRNVVEHLDEDIKPLIINKLIIEANAATSRFPAETNIFWEE
ncbi:MAG: hypothetical protein WCH34_03240 [Bacteroidota bacterium]